MHKDNQIHPKPTLLANEGLREWISISAYILEVEKEGSWSPAQRTFTDWLVDLSSKLSLNESNLWRYYRAGKYYQRLFANLRAKGIEVPSFKLLSRKVSSENLDTLEKIERVAPQKAFLNLATRVIECTIKRDELRSAWVAYRKVLDGKTARGIGVPTPRIDRSNQIQAQKLQEAQLLVALNTSSKEWNDCKDPHMFEVIPSLRFKTEDRSGEIFEVDAAIIFQRDARSPIQFLDVEIKSSNSLNARYDSLEKYAPYFDYQWIAFHQFDVKRGVRGIPSHVGVIAFDGDRFVCIRKAQSCALMGTRSIETAKLLLAKFIKK